MKSNQCCAAFGNMGNKVAAADAMTNEKDETGACTSGGVMIAMD